MPLGRWRLAARGRSASLEKERWTEELEEEHKRLRQCRREIMRQKSDDYEPFEFEGLQQMEANFKQRIQVAREALDRNDHVRR